MEVKLMSSCHIAKNNVGMTSSRICLCVRVLWS